MTVPNNSLGADCRKILVHCEGYLHPLKRTVSFFMLVVLYQLNQLMGLAENAIKKFQRLFQLGNKNIDLLASVVEVEASTSARGDIQKAM